MSDEEDGDLGPLELLQRAHRKETRNLQNKVTALKRSVTKGDKKKKKDVQDEIAKLEADLKLKHEKELADLNISEQNGVELPVKTMEDLSVGVANGCSIDEGIKRISKAQKRREKKAESEKERDRLIAEEQKNAKNHERYKEAASLKATLKERELQLFEIQPDGDCLYNAVAHALSLQSKDKLQGSDVRLKAAQYLRSHKDDFLPFLSNSDGDMLNKNEFEEYCAKVEGLHGPVWGGQPELRALSSAYQVPIEVIQADASPIHFGETFKKEKLVLTYHKHAYQLGEHYNSTEPLVDSEHSD